MIERREIYHIVVGDNILGLHHRGESLTHGRFLCLQQFGCGFNQLLRLGIDVTFLGKFIESVKYSATATARVVLLIAHLRGYAVGCLESDAPYVICKLIRILLDFGDRLLFIFAIYLGSKGGAYAMPLQKHHNLLDVFLFLPAIADFLHSFLAETRHFKQTLDVVFDNVDCLKPETAHYCLGVCRADTLYQTAAEVFLNTIKSGGHYLSP